MPVNLKGRSFLTLKDFTPDEIRYLLNLAADLKSKKRAGVHTNLLGGKNIFRLTCIWIVGKLSQHAAYH